MRPISLTSTLAAAVAAVWAMSVAGAQAQEPIKLGFAGALSGPASFVGVEIKRGAEIAVDEINAKGGVKGHKLVLVSRDDEHNPVKTVAAYRELVERENVVAMIGATNSASMLAVTPIVNDTLKVPVICPATDATAITENDAKKEGRGQLPVPGRHVRNRAGEFHGRYHGEEVRAQEDRPADLDGRLGRHRPRRVGALSAIPTMRAT